MRRLFLILASICVVGACNHVARATKPAPVITAPADPLADYRAKAKHHDTYPPQMLANAVTACYRDTGNAFACICTVWSLADAVSFEDAKALGPEGLSVALAHLYEACEMKHPAPLPPVTSAEQL